MTSKSSPVQATVVALATLAIAVGANTAIFSVVNAVLLERLPYADADRMVRLWQAAPGFGRNGIATLNYLDWQEQNTVFAGMAAYVTEPVTLSDGNGATHVPRRRVSPQYFDLFGIRPTVGRTFTTDDHEPGRNRVAVISHALWTSRFGADPHVIGRSIDLDGIPYAVIGVLPPGSFDRMFPQVWSPLTFTPADMTRDYYWLESVATLRPGVTLAEARAQMDAIAARQASDYPARIAVGVLIEPYADAIVGADLRRSLYLLLASVGLVLAIGCVNIASVMVSRTLARQHEIAVRAALGAGSVRLIKQFLVEAALLPVGGGVLGIAVACGAIAVLRAGIPPFALPAEASVELDGRVLLFALLVSTLNGLAFGLVQALTAARPRLAATLQGAAGYSSSAGRGHRMLRGTEQSWEIVGVVADERVTALESRNNLPGLYLTTMQGPVPPFGQGLVVRGDVGVSLLVKPGLWHPSRYVSREGGTRRRVACSKAEAMPTSLS